jgi:hypothetical protein
MKHHLLGAHRFNNTNNAVDKPTATTANAMPSLGDP